MEVNQNRGQLSQIHRKNASTNSEASMILRIVARALKEWWREELRQVYRSAECENNNEYKLLGLECWSEHVSRIPSTLGNRGLLLSKQRDPAFSTWYGWWTFLGGLTCAPRLFILAIRLNNITRFHQLSSLTSLLTHLHLPSQDS